MSREYRTIQGDTWDIISFKNYGSEKYIDILIDANYRLREVMFFSAGSVIVVPDLDTDDQNSRNLPPWRRNQ